MGSAPWQSDQLQHRFVARSDLVMRGNPLSLWRLVLTASVSSFCCRCLCSSASGLPRVSVCLALAPAVSFCFNVRWLHRKEAVMIRLAGYFQYAPRLLRAERALLQCIHRPVSGGAVAGERGSDSRSAGSISGVEQ